MSGVKSLIRLHASLEQEVANLLYISYGAKGEVTLWERLFEYLVIKLICFSCSCYVLSIATFDVNCERVMILKEADVSFSNDFLNAKK